MNNGKSAFIVTRDELETMMQEQVTINQELKRVINVHAEIIGCHRFILERFVPKPLLEAAANEYRDQRLKEISTKTAEAHGAAGNA